MTVKELLDSVDKIELLDVLYELYPDQKENDLGYKQAILEMLDLTPNEEKTTCRVVIDHVYQEYDYPGAEADDYITIYGIDPQAEEDEFGRSGEDITWAIEYRPWTEWLAMDYECATDDKRAKTPIQHMAHILFEMTWVGYTQKEVSDQFDEIVESKNDLDKLLEEKGHDQAVADGDLIPMDDLIERMKDVLNED